MDVDPQLSIDLDAPRLHRRDVLPPLTFTVPETARMLGISRALAYELVRRGELPAVRLGRRRLVPRAALLELLRGQRGPNQ